MNDLYFKRVAGLVDPIEITAKRVIIVGSGSGGSIIADELGRLGVGMKIIDLPDERLQSHNIIRHVLGADALTMVKHRALAEHILRVNPEAEVDSVGLDVVRDPLALRNLAANYRPHLIIAATDSEESKFSIDAVARELGITVVGGGLYDGGVGGEAYRTMPGKACYGCLFDSLQGSTNRPEGRQGTIDYNNPNLPEFRSTAALRIDIYQIASICVRMGLQELLGGDADRWGIPRDSNVTVYANHHVPGVFETPLRAAFLRIPQSPNCLLCGNHTDTCSHPSLDEALTGVVVGSTESTKSNALE